MSLKDLRIKQDFLTQVHCTTTGGTSTMFTSSTLNSDGSDVKPPASDAPLVDRMAWVHWQLDRFGEQHLFMDRFKCHGPAHRRQGGTVPEHFAR
jgi:hypothetical protein